MSRNMPKRTMPMPATATPSKRSPRFTTAPRRCSGVGHGTEAVDHDVVAVGVLAQRLEVDLHRHADGEVVPLSRRGSTAHAGLRAGPPGLRRSRRRRRPSCRRAGRGSRSRCGSRLGSRAPCPRCPRAGTWRRPGGGGRTPRRRPGQRLPSRRGGSAGSSGIRKNPSSMGTRAMCSSLSCAWRDGRVDGSCVTAVLPSGCAGSLSYGPRWPTGHMLRSWCESSGQSEDALTNHRLVDLGRAAGDGGLADPEQVQRPSDRGRATHRAR